MLANGGTLTATGLVPGQAPPAAMLGGNGGGATAAELAALFGGGGATSNGGLLESALSPGAAAASAFNPLVSMNDAATLLQLSQLFAAQQQHSLAQHFHAAQQQHNTQQQQQHHQPHIMQDKKRSYPCTFQFCVLCQKNVHSSKLPCHIRQCHVAKPMFQCPACDFTSTYSKNNVKSHMVSLHGLAGDPISYMEQYAGQVEEFMKKCFPHVRGRGRPIHGGRLSPASPSSPQQANDAFAQRRNSAANLAAVNTPNMTSQKQYTHSQRRYNSKQPMPISLQDQLVALAKATQERPIENNSSSTSPSVMSPPDHHGVITAIRSLPSATVDVKPGIAIKLEYTEGSSGTEMDTCVSSSANVVDESNRRSASLTNSSTSNAEMRSPLSSSKAQRFIENAQRLQPGDNLQPRYLLHKVNWQVLNDEQIPRTVFDTFNAINTQAIMEKLDLTQFEPLLEESTFLNVEQLERIADVRRQIHLKTFEIMFAVHRLDLAVLSADNVDLVASIAPSAVDIHRFKNYELSNSVSSLGDDEQFILQLSRIDRMEEKLHAMSHMSRFASRVSALNQRMSDMINAAKLLHGSAEFHNILQLLLTCGNLVSGDFNAQIIKGFRTSSLIDMCSFKFPSPSESTLLNVVAECISKHFPELEKFMEHLPLIERAAQTKFLDFCSIVRRLESGHNRVMAELHYGGTTPMVLEFVETAEPVLIEMKDALGLTREKLAQTLAFFGEPLLFDDEAVFEPERFFGSVASFCRSLQTALMDCRQ